MTLPLIHALKAAQGADRELIRTAITDAGDEDRPEPDFARIIGCIDAAGGIEYTRERALDESRAAVAALGAVPESRYRDALAALAEVAVGRDR
jgi:octaprenyl-diphosphate synthase